MQFDGGTSNDGGKAWWPLQDAGLDLIGLCDAGIGSTMLGTVAGTGEGAGARVVGQWTYDAYGRVLTADYPVLTADGQPLLCHPKMGHKGLFVERLDESGASTGTSLISTLSNDPPTLVPRATSIVHMRNRWYSPQLGRFVSVDPNASGMVLLDLYLLGQSTTPDIDGFDLDTRGADGHNSYLYSRGNPVAYGDPSGRIVPVLMAGAAMLATSISIVMTVQDIMQAVAGQQSWLWVAFDLATTATGAKAAGKLLEWAIDGASGAARAVQAGRQASGLATAVELGRAGEIGAGIVKNTERIASLTGTAAYRVPDILDKGSKIIGDVKNVAHLSLTAQLRDYLAFAKHNGYTFVLWTRQNTTFSPPLQKLIDNGTIDRMKLQW